MDYPWNHLACLVGWLIVLWPPMICPSLSILFSMQLCSDLPLWMGHSIPPLLGLAIWLCLLPTYYKWEFQTALTPGFSTSVFALFHNHGNVMPRPAHKTILDHPRAADLQHVTAPSRYIITGANRHSHDWLQMNVSRPRSAKPSLDHLSTAKL